MDLSLRDLLEGLVSQARNEPALRVALEALTAK